MCFFNFLACLNEICSTHPSLNVHVLAFCEWLGITHRLCGHRLLFLCCLSSVCQWNTQLLWSLTVVQSVLASFTHNGEKSQSVSSVMFHFICFMLGRKLTLFGDKNNPFLFALCFQCAKMLHLIPVHIWMVAFLSWGSSVTSVVRCLLLFDLHDLPH